jgi:hypothetical protein
MRKGPSPVNWSVHSITTPGNERDWQIRLMTVEPSERVKTETHSGRTMRLLRDSGNSTTTHMIGWMLNNHRVKKCVLSELGVEPHLPLVDENRY